MPSFQAGVVQSHVHHTSNTRGKILVTSSIEFYKHFVARLQGREWQDYDSDQQALDIDPLLTQPEQVRGRVQQFQDLELRKNTALNLEAETEEVNFKQPEGSVLLIYLKFLTSGAWDDLQKFIEETNQYKYTETH